ncbi:ATP-binding protein [Alphaproteobacteria bacterium]|nr:ATP-binding protein [Alphaproteobacteria bacterium]
MSDTLNESLLSRIADALDRINRPRSAVPDFSLATAFVWHAENTHLEPISIVNKVPITLLKGIDQARDTLLDNTRMFSQGLPANNALLWGARGMGKSSLIKAVHATILEELNNLILIEIHREEIRSLPRLLSLLRSEKNHNFIIFCDDLSFDGQDDTYKALKALLEGGIEGRPTNVLFYATSNRRHLMPRDMIENERSTAINSAEAVDEKVSLSDRFGLWLGFYNCDQETFFAIIDGYAKQFALNVSPHELHAGAIEWSMARGARSGRVAWQFIQDLAGRLGKNLDL